MRSPPTAAATTGVPHAAASSATRPNDSERDGTITTFDAGTRDTWAYAINASGQISGDYNDPTGSPYHGFLREADGSIVSFDGAVQALHTRAQAINSAGKTTGWYEGSNFVTHGFVRESNGTIDSFDTPNARATVPTAIGSGGAVVGYDLDTKYKHRGFLLSRK